MSDIAQELNVSTVTVSNALSDRAGVSEEMRANIKAKAEEMGYHAHSRMNREAIGICIADHFMRDYTSLYQAMSGNVCKFAAANRHYAAIQVVTDEDIQKKNYPSFAEKGRVTGIIVLGPLDTSYIRGLKARGLNVILIDPADLTTGCTSVTSDNYNDFYQLTQRLAGMGFRQFAFVGSLQYSPQIQEQYLGFTKALTDHEINAESAPVIEDMERYDHLRDFALPKTLPEVFVCSSDETARNLINFLAQKSIRVPGDVSVTGYYDYFYATMAAPQITTVRVNLARIAKESVDLALHGDPDTPKRILIPGTLVMRESVRQK